ncbi:hypothetical protein ACHAXN_000705 [Cyclotella atomus]
MSSHVYEPTNARAEESSLSFTILWSPLPPITWLIPFIGHMGIATSRGVACDFQGPYSVGERGRMAFGKPTRVLRVDISSLPGENFYLTCNVNQVVAN